MQAHNLDVISKEIHNLDKDLFDLNAQYAALLTTINEKKLTLKYKNREYQVLKYENDHANIVNIDGYDMLTMDEKHYIFVHDILAPMSDHSDVVLKVLEYVLMKKKETGHNYVVIYLWNIMNEDGTMTINLLINNESFALVRGVEGELSELKKC